MQGPSSKGAPATIRRRSKLPADFRVVMHEGALRLNAGRVLAGGSPFKFFRLSERAAEVVDALASGSTLEEAGAHESDAVGELVRRFLDSAIVHPRPGYATHTNDDVSVIVPVRDRASALARTLDSVGHVGEVIVIDDGSSDESREVARAAGASVIHIAGGSPVGPAAARNIGLRKAQGALVAFVDSDCVLESGWLEPLLPHFRDEKVAAVTPRVQAHSGEKAFARYEMVRSPQDMGPVEGPIQPGGRISYVPTAVLVVRRDTMLSVGGFDEELHVGEDVDFVWRLIDGGFTVRYEPAATAFHVHDRGLGSLLRRHAAYGSSAAPLARRYGKRLSPLRVSAWSILFWGLLAAGRPLMGLGVSLTSAAFLARKLNMLEHPLREAMKLAGLGHLRAGRSIADAVMRTWLPISLLAATVSQRARWTLLVCVLVPALLEWRQRQPTLDPLRYALFRLADDCAYCIGVWQGCLREGTLAPLVPDLSSWPKGREQSI